MLFGTVHADFAGFDHSRLEMTLYPKSLKVVEYVELPETCLCGMRIATGMFAVPVTAEFSSQKPWKNLEHIAEVGMSQGVLNFEHFKHHLKMLGHSDSANHGTMFTCFFFATLVYTCVVCKN